MQKDKIKLSWFDNLIGAISPKAKLRRMKYKYVGDLFQRKYEGASKGRRTEGWCTATNKDANAEISPSLSTLRNRSRDLVRNNPYATRGIQVIQSNTVGKGIITEFKNKTKAKAKIINELWRAWAHSTAIDYEGRHNIFGLQNIVMRSIAESGEILVRLRRVPKQKVMSAEGVEIEIPPIQIQLLESDHLINSDTLIKKEDANSVVQGIEFDSSGKRVAYHLYKQHPGSINTFSRNSYDTVRITANDLAHCFREDRPGQARGVPWVSNVMIRLRDFDEYEDAQLIRQKIAAMFTAFIHDLNGVDSDLTEEEKETELGEKMEPGTIEILPPGKDITLATPPILENYREYTNTVLHSIAAGLGISFEALTGDLSEVNFSSARMGKLEMWRNVDFWQHGIIIPQFMKPVVNWFLIGTELLGIGTENTQTVFTPPKREMVDPTKEVPALQKAIRSGLMTYSEAIRQTGNDPDKQLLEYKEDKDKFDKLGLTLDIDAAKVPKVPTV